MYTYKDFPRENIQSDIAHFSDKGKVILIGDWNGRTGRAKDFVEKDDFVDDLLPIDYIVDNEEDEIRRESEDALVIPDKFGKCLLDICKSTNMRILNGRFGAASSKFTCNNWNGSSVVDYAIVSTEVLKKNKIFEVGEEIDESDHCMIQLMIQNDWENSEEENSEEVKNALYQEKEAFKFPNQ